MEGHQPSDFKFTFGKEERLKNKKLMQELFDKGSSFFLYPVKTYYLADPSTDSINHKVLISTSKKIFKKAVDRNLIKRRIREAYRLNKHLLLVSEQKKQPLLIGFIYVGKQILSFSDIESKLKLILIRLNEVRFN